MAISPRDTYPGQVDVSDPAYPLGKARNVTTPGDGTGTPFEQGMLNDVFGFQQALLAEAGLTASNIPDEVGSSQYLDAVKSVADGRIDAEFRSPGGERIVADEWTYPTLKTRVRAMPAQSFLPAWSAFGDPNPWALQFPPVGVDDQGFLISNVNDPRLVLPLSQYLPEGGTLTRVRVIVKPGAARAAQTSVPGDGGRMWMGIYTLTAAFTGSPSQFLSATPFSGEGEDDGTTDLQVLDTGTISVPIGTKASTVYQLFVSGGADAGTNRDSVGAIELTYSDPGPRNP